VALLRQQRLDVGLQAGAADRVMAGQAENDGARRGGGHAAVFLHWAAPHRQSMPALAGGD
jgi:hypothetical protein